MPLFLPDAQTLMYNVKDYGATGNGVTDDTAAIAAARSAANAAGGGTVFYPAGTYLSGNQTLYSKVHDVGAGVDATTIKLKNSANTDLFSAQTGNINIGATYAAGPTSGVYSWSMRDMTLDGNKANQASGPSYPLRFYGYAYFLSNLKIKNGYSGYIQSDWNGGGTVAAGDSMEARISNVEMIAGCGGIGLEIGGPHDLAMENVISGQATNCAFHIGPNATGVLATNCHGWGMSAGDPSWIIEGIGFQASNCVAEGTACPHLVILANKVSWVGGFIYVFGNSYNSSGVQIGQNASKTLATAITASPASLTTQPYLVAPTAFLQFVVTGAAAGGSIALAGTDVKGNALSETITTTGNGTYTSVNAYNTMNTSGVTITGMAGYSIAVTGLGSPYVGSTNQSGGYTTAMAPYGYVIQSAFADCAAPTGTVWFANDGGGGFIEGPVSTSGTSSPYVLGPTTGASYNNNTYINLTQYGITQDGTVYRGGTTRVPHNSSVAFSVGNGTTDKFNVNTNANRVELVGGALLRLYSDQYSTRTVEISNGTISLLQSTSAAAIASNGTITTSGVGIARVAPTGNVTGIILASGSNTGQKVIVRNESAFTVTFDVSSTSHVADGTTSAIPANCSREFEWSGSLWYRVA